MSQVRADLESQELTRVVLRCDASAPGRVRQLLRSLSVIDLVRDDVLLVASELVSNAVLHAGCDPTDEIEVVAELRASRFRLTVIDPGTSGSMPTVRGSDYRGPGGKGLQVVETLSRRWGSDRRDGTVVWAELSLEAGGSELAPI